MIKCPNCSGELDFDIKDQVVTCPYCDSKFNPKELNAPVKHATERQATEYDTGTTKGRCFTCSQCGAQLVTFDDTAVTFCNYCDSQALLESEMNYINPEVIIPFKKTKEECIDLYKDRLRKALFAPSSFKNDLVVKKFRGIFMPYEIYSIDKHGPFTAKGEVYSHRSGDYVYYDKYDLNGNVDADYEGISYDLSSSYSDDFSHAIPFNYNDIEDFNHNYLVGFYADTKDVNDEIYEDNAIATAKDDLDTVISSDKTCRRYGVNQVLVEPEIKSKKVGLFPVYFASFKNTKGDRIHYAVINGQTGKSAVDLPIDYMKYLIGSVIIAVPLYFIFSLSVSLTAKSVCLISLAALLIAFITQAITIKKFVRKEQKLDDEGFIHSLSEEQLAELAGKKPKVKEEEKKKKGDSSIGTVFTIFIILMYIGIASGIFIINIIAGLILFVGLIVSIVKENTKKTTSGPNIVLKPKKDKRFSYIGKLLIITSFLPIITLLLNPVQDYYYYGAGIGTLLVILLLFKSIINAHNSFMSRPLPQLNKRGGDMNE